MSYATDGFIPVNRASISDEGEVGHSHRVHESTIDQAIKSLGRRLASQSGGMFANSASDWVSYRFRLAAGIRFRRLATTGGSSPSIAAIDPFHGQPDDQSVDQAVQPRRDAGPRVGSASGSLGAWLIGLRRRMMLRALSHSRLLISRISQSSNNLTHQRLDLHPRPVAPSDSASSSSLAQTRGRSMRVSIRQDPWRLPTESLTSTAPSGPSGRSMASTVALAYLQSST